MAQAKTPTPKDTARISDGKLTGHSDFDRFDIEAGRPSLMREANRSPDLRIEALARQRAQGANFLRPTNETEPPPEPHMSPETASSEGQQSELPQMPRSITRNVRERISSLMKELENVTGEPGDVELDECAGHGASLTFKDVSFSVKNKDGSEHVILAPVSGHFERGSLVALMGPSGCGKTTLLDVLADKKTSPYKGEIHLNGRPRDKLFNRVTTYIPQDDIMPPHLTVKEVVTFYMACKMEKPRNLSNANVSYFVDERLKFMGLYEVRNTKIGNETVRGISGGQRRRVSLACGLSSQAQIFFADEPTTGLSGTDAESCVRYMRLLAKKFGLTLIVSIHQPRPEVSRLFDHLLLLTANPGRAVYNGPMHEAASVCERVGYRVPEYANPTDFLLDLVTPDIRSGHPKDFIDYYDANFASQVGEIVNSNLTKQRASALQLVTERTHCLSEDFGEMPPVRNTVYGVRFRRQLRLVFWRQCLLSLRDPLGVGMELGVALGQSVVIGVAYLDVGTKENYNQALFYFMMVMTVALVGMKVMPKLVDERLIIKKETSEALYSDWAYIVSFSVINTIIGLIGNAIFIVCVFWMSDVNWKMLPSMMFWLTLLSLTMDSVYCMVAAIAKDSMSAMTIVLPWLTLFLLYNGFTTTRDQLPEYMKWLMNCSPVAFTMEAVLMSADDLMPKLFGSIVNSLGYRHQEGTAVTFLLCCWVGFRLVGVLCFKHLNNIRR